MSRSTWGEFWVDVTRAAARRSACGRAQVGAVLVRDNRLVSTGYNGPASGFPADTNEPCTSWCRRASGEPDQAAGYGFACPSIHAEANALLYASRAETVGATLYVTHSPCADCAKLISNSVVVRVVLLELPAAHRPDPVPYLVACGVEVEVGEGVQ